MTMMGVLRMLVMGLVWLGTLGALGALAYHRLKDWGALPALVRMGRIRDVVFGSVVLLMLASFANFLVMAAMHEP